MDIKLYQVIYDAIDDVRRPWSACWPRSAGEGAGQGRGPQVFNITKVGTIAGCFVTEGKVSRKAQVRLVRDSVVFTGQLGSLKRFKDDVSEVAAGLRVRHRVEGYEDLKEGDVLEAFETRQVERTLS